MCATSQRTNQRESQVAIENPRNESVKANTTRSDSSQRRPRVQGKVKAYLETPQLHSIRRREDGLAKAKVVRRLQAKADSFERRLCWRTTLNIIFILLCYVGHVHAIQKGRLMTPSSFTALSGDLHVQIQFSPDTDATTPPSHVAATSTATSSADSGEYRRVSKPVTLKSAATDDAAENSTEARTPNTTVESSAAHAAPKAPGAPGVEAKPRTRTEEQIENVIISTLVISKYIGEKSEGYDASSADSSGNVESAQEGAASKSSKKIIESIPLYPDPRRNVTQIAVPCQTFARGGIYEMQVVSNLKTTKAVVPDPKNFTEPKSSAAKANQVPLPAFVVETTTTLVPVADERLRQTLDVRWPTGELDVAPQRLRTYPDEPVEVKLRFPEVNCDRALLSEDLPEFWLELVYCGKERTCGQVSLHNVSRSNILFAEQIRGYPKVKSLKLGCELFGLAGNYAVQLRPMVRAPGVPELRRFLSVDWSDKFVFNVYARSVFPCDPHTGIGVLYEYPSCILEQGDRVRVYAKLRADVASLKPPTTLHYVAEQRVVKGQFSLYFSCELFTEKYVEYCFVYVSQAISGAVADVRMDCVPTLPVSDSDTGGWGPWSDWTACSSNCLDGTRNRYRFCDSPPPRYGAKFCEGASVETEKCGATNLTNTWDCIYETSALNKLNRTEVSQEIGPGCRCGCIVHLGAAKPKRFIAGSTQSCPGRSFWLIQVDGIERISLSFQFLRLPCATQYIKIRDGPSLSSTLLTEFNGGVNFIVNQPSAEAKFRTKVESSGAQILMEFYAGKDAKVEPNGERLQAGEFPVGANLTSRAKYASNLACTGGFLASVEQLARNSTAEEKILLAATRFGSPSVLKTRLMAAKSHRLRNGFTPVHVIAVVFASIIIAISLMLGSQYIMRYRKYHLAIARRRDESSCLHTPRASMSSLQSPPSRAISTTTLLSEVIFLVKMRPKRKLRHSILRESVDAENLALARETEFGNAKVPPCNASAAGDSVSLHLSKRDEEVGSNASIATLRNDLYPPDTQEGSESIRDSQKHASNTEVCSLSGSLTRKNCANDAESIISSGMSSFCHSPPMDTKRLSKYAGYYDAIPLETRNSRLRHLANSPITDGSLSSRASLQFLSTRSASGTLTNVSGCYSPAASVVSTATIRLTNPKESKEKQNRRKLLARPGSEFSLGNQEELELDYYDYNVTNAGAAPGSYLGMDPAYLIWIPPLDEAAGQANEEDGDKTPEPRDGEAQPLYEEIQIPKYRHYLTSGSNSESTTNSGSNANTNITTPSSDEISPQSNGNNSCNVFIRNPDVQYISSSARKPGQSPVRKHECRTTSFLGKDSVPSLHRGTKPASRSIEENKTQTELKAVSSTVARNPPASLPFELHSMTGSYVEKETEVLKSPVDPLQKFLAINDIQFADDECENDRYECHDNVDDTTRSSNKDNNYCESELVNRKSRIRLTSNSSADADEKLTQDESNCGIVIETKATRIPSKATAATPRHTTENNIKEITN